MLWNKKPIVFASFGLALVILITFSCYTNQSWSILAFQESTLSSFEKGNLSNESPYSEEVLRQLYVHKPFNSDVQNRRFLSLTENGTRYFAFSKSNHEQLCSKEPYLSRRKELRDRCSKQHPEKLIDLSRFIYDDKYKVIMCSVPKAACTTWKSYIWYLKGKVNKPDIAKVNRTLLDLQFGYLQQLSSLSKPEALKRLLTYTSFFVTRHPFERLVSAHNSKFTDRAARKWYMEEIGRDIAFKQAKENLKGLKYNYTKDLGASIIQNKEFLNLDQMEQEAALRYIETMNNGNISFYQFAKYLARNKKNHYLIDVHWRPQTTLCNPCLVNYDFIVQFENLAKDSNVLLEYLQRGRPEHEKVFFDSNYSHRIDRQKTFQAFKSIDDTTMSAIAKLYSNDFRTLGYSSSLIDHLNDRNR